MSKELKPNQKYHHVCRIIRYETNADDDTPLDLRITIKRIVTDSDDADTEVKRLNALNRNKGCCYFSQIRRFEDVPVKHQAVSSLPWAITEEPQA